MEVLFAVRLAERRRVLGIGASAAEVVQEPEGQQGDKQPALEVPELEEEKKEPKRSVTTDNTSTSQGLDLLLAGAVPKIVLKHAVAELKNDGTPTSCASVLCMSVYICIHFAGPCACVYFAWTCKCSHK